ncbi:HAMP domain-containing histidine kinase [Glaciihabitans sp. INWT7]|uniref:sensor histidine kinase n=1 Tax=Glaciihabitans sp. INWT7 TaxID=2596912 RepID=UPI0016270060|nr:HAMP domain-containing sensor histidine kinase [Glaciihabitans sp. INWT7]QNE47676.1 HAMP domain-containing histidine kinase [Glaciihabitans sp. INWT7]
MSMNDLLVVSLLALGCAVVVGVVSLVVLRFMTRYSLVLQLCVVALAAVLSIAGGVWLAASVMLVTPHDLTVLLSVAAIAGVVSLALAAVLGRSLVRNSRQLIAATRRIGTEEAMGEQVRHSSNEFAALALELTATNSRLAESRAREALAENSRRELVAWISHDLRTPLAGIRAMAEALEDGMVDEPERYYVKVRSQVDRMSGMVDDLNELTRIHSGSLRLSMQKVSLYDLISDVVAELGPFAESRSISLIGDGARELTILADPRELSRVVGNLVMNSIQHSPAGSPITVSARQSDDGLAVISVIDAAGGIPEKDLGRVFEAGWRASNSRTPETATTRSGGAGLGLAIVQGIVQAHRGRVVVQNVPGGCRFDVFLPPSPTDGSPTLAGATA